MNEGINNRQKKKISLMEIFIPLFCLINQYEIAGLHLGLICVIAVVAIYFIKYREFYLYKPLFIFFLDIVSLSALWILELLNFFLVSSDMFLLHSDIFFFVSSV